MDDALSREYHDLGDLDGARVTVVIHNSGRRDLFLRTLDDDEPVARLTFNEEQARLLAEALQGTPEVGRVSRSA